MLTWLAKESEFPPLQQALRAPNGLLAAGGDLTTERLVAAYRHGCFPWYQEGQPILWWSPDPRTLLFVEELHVAQRLARLVRNSTLQVTYDIAFNAVIQACAGPRAYSQGTWITQPMQAAYTELHARGIAHSVEVWQDDQLVGGLYGLAMGRWFFGESMFSHVSNASKVAFVHLVRRLQASGFVLVDCQMPTAHLASFGARAIPRALFAEHLTRYLEDGAASYWNAAVLNAHQRVCGQ